ncbi:unnamed protein product, partial [Medioppia subpectinata]
GIPYATPPVGDLRFRPTVPISYTQKKSINATQFSLSCPQTPNLNVTATAISEDCLYVNIYTPSVNKSANLSVMFWIFGGGFTTGSAVNFDGQQLAIRDVVIVTFNYRVAVFGFMCTDRPDAPGNAGLWDQVMAMNWTKQYIRHFGGNPNDITIFGESAGAISVSAHVVSNVSNGTILTSSTGSQSSNTQIAKRFARFLGCDTNTDYIACLRTKSVEELMNAQNIDIVWNRGTIPAIPLVTQLYPFTVCYGDQYLPKNPYQLLKQHNFRKDLHIMIGHNMIEGAIVGPLLPAVIPYWGQYDPRIPFTIIDKQLAEKDLLTIFDNQPYDKTLAQKYTQTFSNWYNISQTNDLRATVVQAIADYLFACPT